MIGNPTTVDVTKDKGTVLERAYLGPVAAGLSVTIRHFMRNLLGKKDIATYEWPEEKRPYSNRVRGRHMLTVNEDGSLRCVACMMCATACPAGCITIIAEEVPGAEDPQVEKRPKIYEIDLLRCVYCGYCVEACPKQALVMTRQHEMAFKNRQSAVVGIEELKQRGPIEKADLGWRPYF